MLGWHCVSSWQDLLMILVYNPNTQKTAVKTISKRMEYLRKEKNKGNPTPKKDN